MKFAALSLFTLVACAAGQVNLHPRSLTDQKCLEVRGNIRANGTPVQISGCNGTPGQKWDLVPGSTAVRLHNSTFCLDAGSAPTNGTPMKIWECFKNLPAQEWFLTDDRRIALEGQGFCLDLPNGDFSNGRQVQIWKCTDNDMFQVWV